MGVGGPVLAQAVSGAGGGEPCVETRGPGGKQDLKWLFIVRLVLGPP